MEVFPIVRVIDRLADIEMESGFVEKLLILEERSIMGSDLPTPEEFSILGNVVPLDNITSANPEGVQHRENLIIVNVVEDVVCDQGLATEQSDIPMALDEIEPLLHKFLLTGFDSILVDINSHVIGKIRSEFPEAATEVED